MSPGSWFTRHAQNAVGALGTLSRNPVATALTVTVIGIALVLLVALTQMYFQNHFFDAWRADLAQEARWTAIHWGADADPTLLAQAWRTDGSRSPGRRAPRRIASVRSSARSA